MSFLYFLEGIRCPVLDLLFSVITHLGEETLFLIIGLIFLWCISKRDGYYLLCISFLGLIINQFLKILCRVPRPWVKDPNFSIVESARAEATGYSFPSGHTQISVGLYGGIARSTRHTWLRICAIALCVLIPFSRLYLGVHTPADVLTSVGIALVLVLVGYPIVNKLFDTKHGTYILFGILGAASVAFLCFMLLCKFPESVYLPENIGNLVSAQESSYTFIGCLAGISVGYFIDKKYIKFETQAPFWIQVIKVIGGVAVVLLVKECLKPVLNVIFSGHMVARAVRYFFVALTGAALWPMSFRWLCGLSKQQ